MIFKENENEKMLIYFKSNLETRLVFIATVLSRYFTLSNIPI